MAPMSHLDWAFVAVVTVVSAARLARLVVFDHWPPIVWLRTLWDEKTGNSGWNLLLHCHICFTVWTAFGVLLWGYFADFNEAWWLVNGGLAAAYAAMYVVTFDGNDD